MVAIAPIPSKTNSWEVANEFPKPHSRARENIARRCTVVAVPKSSNCIDIRLTIYVNRIRLVTCSRDPMRYHDGDHLYRHYFETWGTDPSGTSCSVADCVDRCRSLPVWRTGGNRSSPTHPRQECIDRCNDAARRFIDWFDTQVRNGLPNFSALPPCPCEMTKCRKIACAGVGDPGHAYETFCAPLGWSMMTPVTYPIYLPRYHPGAVWELRSLGGPPRTQCTYDAAGNLITTGAGIGTVDIEWLLWHIPIDVTPIDWIIALEGGTLVEGCWFNMYKRVRPLMNGNKCGRNP